VRGLQQQRGRGVGRWRSAVVQIALVCGAGGLQAQALPLEQPTGTNNIIDMEFDWARDGVLCATCNFGVGNSRFAFIDNENKLWVGQVDFNTGAFYPPDGRGTLIDPIAVAPREVGNGPEWAFSQRGSELVYDRWTDGQPRTLANMVLGFARMGNGSWVPSTVEGSGGMALPVGSMDPTDDFPSVHYQNLSLRSTLYWRDITPGAAQVTMPLSSTDKGMTRRWVPGTRDIIITALASAQTQPGASRAGPTAAPVIYKQVFLFHTGTGELEQLTFDPVDKLWGFMWSAPEYDNEKVFFVVTGGNKLSIYRKLPRWDGQMRWRVVSTIDMPTATPYINSPEPFVHNGKSYIFFALSSNPDLHDYTATTLIAITGLEPGSLKALTSDTNPARVRKDPEYFVTANGPYLYYNRYLVPGSPDDPRINEGVFRVDTGLGPPVR
jgi:hypothetical protein